MSTSHSSRISQEAINLYDEYTHKPLPRRDFLQRLARVAGSTAAAYALLPMLENNYARAAMVEPDDKRIHAQKVTYPSPKGEISGYMAVPENVVERGLRLPVVIVIHENRGLNPHIQDLTRRLALAGYCAIAPDYLSLQGGTPKDEDQAREMFTKLPDPEVKVISQATYAHFSSPLKSTGKVAAVGFCWGGAVANELAAMIPELCGVVVYYGMQPKLEEVPKIQAPLLLHYASLDTRINAGIPAFESALKAGNKPYTLYMYEGVNHAFNNDTNAARYDETAAKLSWARTLEFLAKNLR